MNEQEQFWAGEFGDSYTQRNRINWLQRVPFWTGILYLTGANTVLEVGANVGWNLLALRIVKPSIFMHGIDVNEGAVKQARSMELNVVYSETIIWKNSYDLAFTAGCLIHIGPGQIEKTMEQVITHSAKYILAVEYAADKEEEIEYRGHRNKLWKRPYGKLYQDMGLKLVETGELPKDSGFDDCTYWLLEK